MMATTELINPVTLDGVAASWAEEVEKETRLPPVEESIKDGVKTRVEYKRNDKNQKVKVVSTFKVETKKVPKPIAARKKLRKFGAAAADAPGPNPANTLPGEEVRIQFTRNRAGELNFEGGEGDAIDQFKKTGGGVMRCRFCKQNDHWSVSCPYKDLLDDQADEEGGGAVGGSFDDAERKRKIEELQASGRYVPPSLRSGASARGVSMNDPKGRDENTVRVTNLPEDTTDQDLRDLFQNIGRVTRIFLAKDKQTGRSKGFAFVTYERRDDAERAIQTISGHRYDYVILKVEWAK